MTRRSITQTLCAAALALMAPLAAFAESRKRDPRALGRDGKWHRASFVTETPDCGSWRRVPCENCGASVALANLQRPGERAPCWSGFCDCGWYIGKPWRHQFSDAWGAAVTWRKVAESRNADLRALLAEAREHLKTCDRVPHNQAAYVHESVIARIDNALK